MPKYDLWPHQERTVQFARSSEIIFDTSTAGTGKTLAHLTVFKERFEAGASRALIVCPKTLMRSAWANEIDESFPSFSYSLAYAPAASREAAFDSDSDIVLVNTDALPWLSHKGKRWFKQRFGSSPMLLIDESSWLKNPAAQRTKAGIAVSEAFQYRTCMSGTPAPTSVVELWPQVKILDGGERLGKRFTVFDRMMRTKVFTPGGFPIKRDVPDAPVIAYGLIHDITIGHRFDDVMKHVPAMEDRIVYYDLPSKHRDVYEELVRTSRIELGQQKVTAVNAGVLANKLLQCASGAVYTDPTTEERGWHLVDTGRYELITDLVEARDQTVVFFLWKHQRDVLIEHFKRKKLTWGLLDSSVPSAEQRNKYVQQLQNGDIRCLLMHYETGSFGLTLTKARTVIWASPIYHADKKEQGDARIRRGRQDQPTESIVLLARNTRDIHAYGVFSGKKTRMDALAELLQQSQ